MVCVRTVEELLESGVRTLGQQEIRSNDPSYFLVIDCVYLKNVYVLGK